MTTYGSGPDHLELLQLRFSLSGIPSSHLVWWPVTYQRQFPKPLLAPCIRPPIFKGSDRLFSPDVSLQLPAKHQVIRNATRSDRTLLGAPGRTTSNKKLLETIISKNISPSFLALLSWPGDTVLLAQRLSQISVDLDKATQWKNCSSRCSKASPGSFI